MCRNNPTPELCLIQDGLLEEHKRNQIQKQTAEGGFIKKCADNPNAAASEYPLNYTIKKYGATFFLADPALIWTCKQDIINASPYDLNPP